MQHVMKKRFLFTAIAVATLATMAFATDGNPPGYGSGSGNTGQQVIVNNYYLHGGYEYASRIKRFHTSYTTFDFYSPMYTEVYWYRYTPYTWGVSIYDDWYYYGGNVSRYNWTSGFGGSYWWGYEPWWGYNSRLGYGWSSWYTPGFSYSVNYYLGRPHYHYPVAYNGWNSHRYVNHSRSVTVINNNTYNYYYGSEKRNSHQGSTAGYNPANPATSGRRSGYTVTGGRSSASGTAPASSGTTGTQTGTQTDTRTGTRTGTRSTTQAGNQGGRATGQQTRTSQGTPVQQTSADRAPARTTERQRVQSTVRSTTRRGETVMRQGTPAGTPRPVETTVQQGSGKKAESASETTGTGSESRKITTSSKKRR